MVCAVFCGFFFAIYPAAATQSLYKESSSGKTNLHELLKGGASLTQSIKLPAGNWDEMKEETAHKTVGTVLDKTAEEIQHYCHGYLYSHGLTAHFSLYEISQLGLRVVRYLILKAFLLLKRM